jgi:hypothetical protein
MYLGKISLSAILIVLMTLTLLNNSFSTENNTADKTEPQLKYHTMNSPEWLRLCRAACAMHPYPTSKRTIFLRYYTDPYRIDADNSLWKPVMGADFKYIFPYQGIPGVMYVPAGWASQKVGDVNSVKNINYKAFGDATKMLHRKGAWMMPHVPAQVWWGATSNQESSQDGALYINMQLLSLEDPPDGFNFDASLEIGTDIDAIRKKADEVLPKGHYSMHAESGGNDPAGFNTHYTYLFGKRETAWADDLHGIHYLWFAIRGLSAHDVGEEWGRKLFKLMLWDCLVWGGATGYNDLPPAHYYDRRQTLDYIAMTESLYSHSDLLGLIRNPKTLPKEALKQQGFYVNVFDGSEPSYFKTESSPGADKIVYTFKTGGAPMLFGDPAYYESMPPVPFERIQGDLFETVANPQHHFITSSINGSSRTPVRQEGEKAIIGSEKPLARYGTLPQGDETLYIIDYKNILSVGRRDSGKINVTVNKAFAENLLVETRLIRNDDDELDTVVSRYVINGEAIFDIQNDFAAKKINPGDKFHIRLLREHPLDRWHIPYFLCDEVVIFGKELETFGYIRTLLTQGVDRDSVVALEAEVGNNSAKPRDVTLTWELPNEWTVAEGDLNKKISVPANGTVRVPISFKVSNTAPFGGHKIRITVDSGETVQGTKTNCAYDSRLIVVKNPTAGEGAQAGFLSVETGGFKGVTGVTIPITHDIAAPPAGKSYRVIEYDQNGEFLPIPIESQFVPVNQQQGKLCWFVEGNDKPVRNFQIRTIDTAEAQSNRKLLLASGQVVVPQNLPMVSDIQHKYCTLDIDMAVPYSKKEEAWVGFKNYFPEGWAMNKFQPDKPVNIILWRFIDDREHLVTAIFDNGSGMPEISSGKYLDVENYGSIDCNRVWGDFGWTYGNDRLDRINPGEKRHLYRIEWSRFYQRWYVDGVLAYERRIALDESLPLVIENKMQLPITIIKMDVRSPYCRK